MIELAIVTGLGLKILSASPLGALRAVVLALALGALAWAVLDVREIIHQANESRTELAIVAGAVTALHTIAAVLAVWLVAAPGRKRHPQAGTETHTQIAQSAHASALDPTTSAASTGSGRRTRRARCEPRGGSPRLTLELLRPVAAGLEAPRDSMPSTLRR